MEWFKNFHQQFVKNYYNASETSQRHVTQTVQIIFSFKKY
jgi:hypothetical protein